MSETTKPEMTYEQAMAMRKKEVLSMKEEIKLLEVEDRYYALVTRIESNMLQRQKTQMELMQLQYHQMQMMNKAKEEDSIEKEVKDKPDLNTESQVKEGSHLSVVKED